MELTQRILDYDKHLSEGEYLDEFAGSVAVNDWFAATVELLQSSDVETLPATLLFVLGFPLLKDAKRLITMPGLDY
jgi:hypothetical protein